MYLVLVFPLLGLLLAAVQFTEQAEEYQKVESFLWASEQSCAGGCGVLNESQNWHRGRVGLSSLEQEQQRRKREKKSGRSCLWAVTSYWLDSELLWNCRNAYLSLHILQFGKCRSV